MKKIVTLILLCVGMLPLVYGMEIQPPITIEEGSDYLAPVKLDPNNFRMFGKNNCFADIKIQFAQSVPLFADLIQQKKRATNDELLHALEDDLEFLEDYVKTRLGLSTGLHNNIVENAMIEKIEGLDFPILARRTMLIAKIYALPTQKMEVPKLFELAWSSQLHDQRLGQDNFRDHLLESFSMNKDLVDSIMVLAASNLSGQGATVQPENDTDKGKTKNPSYGLQDKLRSYAAAAWQMIPGENKMVTLASAATCLIALYMYFRSVK